MWGFSFFWEFQQLISHRWTTSNTSRRAKTCQWTNHFSPRQERGHPVALVTTARRENTSAPRLHLHPGDEEKSFVLPLCGSNRVFSWLSKRVTSARGDVCRFFIFLLPPQIMRNNNNNNKRLLGPCKSAFHGHVKKTTTTTSPLPP